MNFIKVQPTQIVNFENVNTVVKALTATNIYLYLQNGIKIDLAYKTHAERDEAFNELAAKILEAKN